MWRFSRNTLLATIAVTAAGCGSDSSSITDPDDKGPIAVHNVPVRTSAVSYRLDQTQGGGIVTVEARYRNETGRNLYYPNCGMAHVRRSGADSLRTLFTAFGACSMDGNLSFAIIKPGDSLTVNVKFGTPEQPSMNPPLQPEWLTGTMRVVLSLCAKDATGGCTALPEQQRQSNAFEVHY